MHAQAAVGDALPACKEDERARGGAIAVLRNVGIQAALVDLFGHHQADVHQPAAIVLQDDGGDAGMFAQRFLQVEHVVGADSRVVHQQAGRAWKEQERAIALGLFSRGGLPLRLGGRLRLGVGHACPGHCRAHSKSR
ncbi:hypothetical protein D3C85_1262550 [compost metagenome]